MEQFPLNARMPNEATIADWLGTAMVAARIASSRLDLLREEDYDVARADDLLERAEDGLQQALDEVRAVRSRVAGLVIARSYPTGEERQS